MTRSPPGPRWRRDAGSAALEIVVLTPALLALLLLVVAAGRVATAAGRVDGAARDAARAASLQRSAGAGQAAADATARATLNQQDLRCTRMDLTVTGDYAAPPGTAGAVRVAVACTVSLSDLALPGLPGATTLRAGYAAVLDTHRGRVAP